VLYAFPRSRTEDAEAGEHDGGLRLGVSVGRRVGAAVSRNMVKRTLREAFWTLAETLPGDHDYVVVARAGTAGLTEREGLEGVQRELSELLDELNRSGSVRSDGGEA
jgi:ribonuclease P protein component